MSQGQSKRSDAENALKELAHRILHPGVDRGWTQTTIRELNERKQRRQRELDQHFLASVHASVVLIGDEFERDHADSPDTLEAQGFQERAVKRLRGETSVLHPLARKSMQASEWKHVVSDVCKTVSDRQRTRIANTVIKSILEATPGEQGSKSAVERISELSKAMRGTKPNKLKIQTNAEFEQSFDQHLPPAVENMLSIVINAVCPDFARAAVRDAALEALRVVMSKRLDPFADDSERTERNS